VAALAWRRGYSPESSPEEGCSPKELDLPKTAVEGSNEKATVVGYGKN
jgi:hypothetical protein